MKRTEVNKALALAALALPAAQGGGYMDCGSGVKLCGVLTLESGLGSGNYEVPVRGLNPSCQELLCCGATCVESVLLCCPHTGYPRPLPCSSNVVVHV